MCDIGLRGVYLYWPDLLGYINVVVFCYILSYTVVFLSLWDLCYQLLYFELYSCFSLYRICVFSCYILSYTVVFLL